jgi:hypothetical protein
LRTPGDAETRVRSYDNSVKEPCRGRACPCPKRACPYKFILENGEGRRVAQSVERVVRTACADAQTVDEKE